MAIHKIALRNLFRQRRRSVLTALTMAGGFLLCSFSLGVSEGTYNSLIEMFTRDRVGHVQVHVKGYLDRPSLYDTIDDPSRVAERISTLPEVEAWAPRVYSPALAAVGKKTAGAQVMGVEPALEGRATRLRGKVTAGAFLSDSESREVMLGNGLAEVLRAEVGDEVVLIGQAADGSIANDLFQVVGVIGTRDDARERVMCYMHLATAQAFLSLGDRVHELAVVLNDQSEARASAIRMREAIWDSSLDISPWQVVEASFYQAMKADIEGMWISLAIIMLIVGIGVLETVLMTILERTREFGVLRALGTRPATVFKLIVLETAFLSCFSIMLGAVASLVCNSLLAEYGIEYPTPIEYGGFMFDRMVGQVSLRVFWIPAVLTFGTAVFVSIFPGIRAARVVPVVAMRHT